MSRPPIPDCGTSEPGTDAGHEHGEEEDGDQQHQPGIAAQHLYELRPWHATSGRHNPPFGGSISGGRQPDRNVFISTPRTSSTDLNRVRPACRVRARCGARSCWVQGHTCVDAALTRRACTARSREVESGLDSSARIMGRGDPERAVSPRCDGVLSLGSRSAGASRHNGGTVSIMRRRCQLWRCSPVRSRRCRSPSRDQNPSGESSQAPDH